MTAPHPDLCADCNEPAYRLFYYVNRLICGDCLDRAKDAADPVSDHADDPRHGQAAGLNKLRREL